MRAMKDSGIEWIGEIPQDWEVSKITSIYQERNATVSDNIYQPLSVTKSGIVLQLDTAAKTDNNDNRKLVIEGDFVINSRSDRRGSCGISDYTGSVSVINIVLYSIKKINNEYYYYLYKTERFADEFYKLGYGIVDDLWSTKWRQMKNIYVPLPPLPEQQAIADYLDRKCGQIESIISKQQTVIEKLKACKQSTITEAVTKGLDPSVPMKDSGIEWIGEIPQAWEVNRLKFVTECNKQNLSENTSKESEFVYIDISSVTSDGTIENTEVTTFEKSPSRARRIIYTNDIIVSTVRTYLKAIAYIVDRFNNQICSTGFAVLTTKSLYDAKFMYYFIRCNNFIQQVESNSVGISYPAIASTTLISFNVIIPLLHEQQAIADYLDNKCAKIDSAIEQKQKLIDKLNNYKKSLIFEAVTGKIEV